MEKYMFKNKSLRVPILLGVGILSSVTILGHAQDTTTKPVTLFDYGQINGGIDQFPKVSYEDSLYNFTLENFEEGSLWYPEMSADAAHVSVQTKAGAPSGLLNTQNGKSDQSKPAGAGSAVGEGAATSYIEVLPDTKKSVLGVKVSFNSGRRKSYLRLNPSRPMDILGIVKGFEIWVNGRNKPHQMFVIVEDAYRQERLISMGNLAFEGWRKLTARVPDYISQSKHNISKRGLIFKGILISFDLLESLGDYYIYFDNISAEVSRYIEDNQLKDDISDVW